MKILFVCSSNQNRSKTAENYFKYNYPQHIFKSAGTNHRLCEKAKTNQLTVKKLRWADVIFVMEEHHKNIILKHTGDLYLNKINVLDIKDIYKYNQKELIELLSKLEIVHEFLEN